MRHEPASLDFLDPPSGPEELGRLAFYRILRKLGEGGTSIVFEAEDTRLNRIVALKVLKPDLACRDVSSERFYREARAAASVSNDHVEKIHHVGRHRDIPFIDIEYLDGETLRQRMKHAAPLDMRALARIGREIAEGLRAAHAQGLIHRDIKPSNLWLDPAGAIKVLDFGLARTIDPEDRFTAAGHPVGTPLYMSPEQARGEEVDHRTDLYSLGCVLYELATGIVPIKRATMSEFLAALSNDEPAPLRQQNEAVPPALEQLVQRLLAKRPVDRPQTADQVVRSLAAVEADLGKAAPERMPAPRASARPLPGPRLNAGLVRGETPSFEEETNRLLRFRLKTLALALGAAATFSFFNSALTANNRLLELRLLLFAATMATFLVLTSKRPFTLRQLRWWELGVMGPPVILLLTLPVDMILEFAHAGNAAAVVALRAASHGMWAFLLMLYAVFIPNTWRRAALILLPASAAPVLICEVLQRIDPLVRFDYGLVPFMQGTVHWPILAGPIAVYTVHIIHALRQDAYEARRLGEYVLHEKIGAGAHGEVFSADHVFLQRPCVMKLIPTADVDEADLLRFEGVVGSAAALKHWNVADIYDFGRTGASEFYYVMERLAGFNLAQLLEMSGPLSPGRAIFLLRQVCAGLQEAHRTGLNHLNLKPTNVLVTELGGRGDVVRLVDFGLLKRGDPSFRSPEQLKEAGVVDGRSDIYSLGAIAYFLVTGRPPFTAPTPVEIVVSQLRDPPTPPTAWRDDVPADLEQVILRCLQKEPSSRFQTAASLAEALNCCADADAWTDDMASDWWRALA